MDILLLIDIGNSRVKWARLAGTRMGLQHAAAIPTWTAEEYAQRLLKPARAGRIVVSSVAGPRVNRLLIEAAHRTRSPAPEFVTSQRRAAGISTGYLEPWRLGVDRFVSVIGAHHIAAGKAVCVVSIGTAITLDLVDGGGHHLGGAILPGPVLMVESLLSSTSGIRRRAGGGSPGKHTLFAQTTRTAIQQGALHAAAAVIDRAVEEARAELRPATRRRHSAPLVLLTGGGAAAVKSLIRTPHIEVPHLVLHGLAVWAGQPPLEPRLN